MEILKRFLCISIGLTSFPIFGDMAGAKMIAMPAMVSTTETVTYYQTIQKKRKLNPDESNIFHFIQVARDVFKVQNFVVEGHYSETLKEKALNSKSVASAIQKSIKQMKSWDDTISAKDLDQIKSIEELLKSNLGLNSYAAAWLFYKNGNKIDSKEILNRGFDLAYENAMKMEYMGFSDEANPIQDADSFSKALSPLSTEAENKARAVRLRKMQVRASNLPQIMT